MSSKNTAILVAHGQPSAPLGPEEALSILAKKVSSQLKDWDIRAATLASPGRLESVMHENAVIYPFFMAQGWFTAKVLPERLLDWSYKMACPFGLDPELPALACAAVQGAQHEAGWDKDPINLLLAAHGSARGPKAAEAAKTFAKRLSGHLPGARIEAAYVEQAPGIADAARALPERTLCLPFFAQHGDHVRQDIPDALTEAGFSGNLMPVLGACQGTDSLIARAILRCDQEGQI